MHLFKELHRRHTPKIGLLLISLTLLSLRAGAMPKFPADVLALQEAPTCGGLLDSNQDPVTKAKLRFQALTEFCKEKKCYEQNERLALVSRYPQMMQYPRLAQRYLSHQILYAATKLTNTSTKEIGSQLMAIKVLGEVGTQEDLPALKAITKFYPGTGTKHAFLWATEKINARAAGRPYNIDNVWAASPIISIVGATSKYRFLSAEDVSSAIDQIWQLGDQATALAFYKEIIPYVGTDIPLPRAFGLSARMKALPVMNKFYNYLDNKTGEFPSREKLNEALSSLALFGVQADLNDLLSRLHWTYEELKSKSVHVDLESLSQRYPVEIVTLMGEQTVNAPEAIVGLLKALHQRFPDVPLTPEAYACLVADKIQSEIKKPSAP